MGQKTTMSSAKLDLINTRVTVKSVAAGSDALQQQLRQLQGELLKQGEALHREQAQCEAARQDSEHELRIATAVFDAQNATLVTDPQGKILRVNEAFAQTTGYSALEAVGQSVNLFKSERHAPPFLETMWQSLQADGVWQGEIWIKSRSGQDGIVLLSIKAVVTPERGVTHYVGNFSDVSLIKDAEALTHRLAYYDALTHLPNRRLLRDRLTQALLSSERTGRFGALFLVNIDNFRAINDTMGLELGDLLLQEIACSLQALVREVDTVARPGNAEFVVLLQDLAGSEHDALARAQLIGAKLQSAVPNSVNLKGHEFFCGLSVGGVLFQANNTFEELLTQADLALRQAKNSGSNSLRFFAPALQLASDLRSTMESELKKALQWQQLCLYYQPQLDAALHVVGVEALIRWQHPLRGLVSPVEFIPLAEEIGLIFPIGLWVMQSACAQIKAWQQQPHLEVLKVAVNVSARQFGQADFVKQVQTVLDSSGANPARLTLELTESLILENVRDVVEKMNAIKRLGVSFSMDDFGTGYSSLAYLAQLPIDQLKIDKSFVQKIPGQNSDETITRTIISMGRGLNMDVIAEGVETQVQREFLERHGCHTYQGYLFSQPLPLAKLEAFVKLAAC